VSLARTLWKENADLAAAALSHPFVRGIADGSLPRDAFAAYIAQDAFFLDGFARAYALALARSPNRASLDAFADLLAGVREEVRLHGAYAARWGIDFASVVASAATRAYTDFLLARASLGGVGLTCAAMTPCMRLYAHLGHSLAGTEAGPYIEWVQTYADPTFEELAARLERLLDAHATDEPETHATYHQAMELEIAFFDDVL
jgi:thiaminase (transcriptional activator TenA)